MKKLLLLAACFAAFTMSAQEFTLTEMTSTANVPTDRANNRQGFGYNGNFVVLDKVLGQLNFYNPEDGSLVATGETGATASWPAVTIVARQLHGRHRCDEDFPRRRTG